MNSWISSVNLEDEFERAKAEIERMNAEIETLKKSADEAIGDAQRIRQIGRAHV